MLQWHFTNEKSGKRFCYDIVGTAGREDPFFLTEERKASGDVGVGCTVLITEIERSLHQLLQSDTRREYASVFAPFLLRHTDCKLIYNGKPIRPGDAVASSGRIRSIYVDHDGQQHQVTFEVIH